MASISLADQLEDAIDMMMSEHSSAAPKVDVAIGNLLEIAEELRLLPDPEFKAALKNELLGECQRSPVSLSLDIRRKENERTQSQKRRPRDASAAQILPGLFGAGSQTYPVKGANFAISAAIHSAVIIAVATMGLWMAKQTQIMPHATSIVLTEMITPSLPPDIDKSRGGGGGGDRDKLAESHGSLPRFAHEQLTPPAIVVRNEHPVLPAEPTIVGPPELSVPPASQTGNPLSAILETPSNGPGFGSGIGNGHGGGVGPGEGPGFGPGRGGGTGGGAFRVGGGVSAPRAIYAPDPEYSEEARQAKYQGTVLLWIVVGPDGRPRDIRVQRSLGMGLDEKAVEAVKQWRFDPSMMDGHPVAVQVNVEVSFRLY